MVFLRYVVKIRANILDFGGNSPARCCGKLLSGRETTKDDERGAEEK
jgi:hypothetical protein